MTDSAPLHLSGDELFHALVEATDAITFVVDLSRPNAPPLYVSPQTERLLGPVDRHAAWGPQLAELLHPDDGERVLTAIQDALAERAPFDEEFRVCRPDGSYVWLLCRGKVVPATEERPALWVGTATDVTEHHERQDRARLDALYHRSLVDQLPGIVYRLTNEAPVAQITYISPQIEEVFGYAVQEWLDDPSLWVEALHSDDRERVFGAWGAAVAAGEPYLDEYRLVRPDGRTIWVRERLIPIRDADGAVVEWQGLTLDVTEAHRVEEEKALSDERYRMFVEHVPALVFTMDPRGGVQYVGPQLAAMLGYAGEPWRDDPYYWVELIHPDDRADVVASWGQAVRARTPFRARYRMVAADGSAVWIHEHSHPSFDEDGNIRFWQGVALDVTATHEAESALAASEARYRTLIEQLPAVVYVVTDEDDPSHLYVSSAAAEMLGYAPDAYRTPGFSWLRTVHPDDASRVHGQWREAVRTGRPFELEYRLVRPDGEEVWVRDACVRIDADDGTRTWQGVLLDVTRQVLAELEADTTAARYQALVEGIPAVVYEMGPDDERRTLYVGPQIEELLGYSRTEWLEQPDIWSELLHPDDREIELAAHDRHNETGEPWRRDYRLIANDGRVVWVRDQAVLVRDVEGRARTWQGVLLDVTAQKAAEAELRKANDELEFRVAARTSQLEDANELMSLEITERRRIEQELRGAETRYRRLVEDIPAVIYRWQAIDVAGGSVAAYVSPQIEQLLGFSPGEWHEDWGFWRTRLHPHDKRRVEAAVDRVRHTGEPLQLEYRYLARDGRVVWVLDRASLLSRDDAGRPFVFQGVMLDITPQKIAEAKAEAAEERFREVAETAPAITYVLGLTGDEREPTVDFMSPQIEEVLGFPVDRWIRNPRAWTEIIHPDDRERVLETATASFGSGAPWVMDYRVIAADGRVVWIHSRGRCAARDDQGRPGRFVGVLLDVTGPQDAAHRTREDLRAATALLEGMPGVPWTELLDPETGWHRFAYIGPQVRDLFGYTAEELVAEPRHFERLLHPDDRVRTLEGIRRAERLQDTWADEFRVVRRDGVVRRFYAAGRRVTPGGVVPAVWQGVTVDITDAPLASRRGSRAGAAKVGRRKR